MLAVTQNAPGCVAALLNPPAGSRRADVNLANGSGETPLIRAVQLRNLDLVRTLLKAGADPDQADPLAGLSARDYARNDSRSPRSEEHTSELQSLMRISYAAFCLK